MKELMKITLTFKELYDNYSVEKVDNEIVKPKAKLYIKNSEGKLSEINGLIRKTNNTIIESVFSNNQKLRSSDKHLIKTEDGFKFINNIENDNILVYNGDSIKLRNKEVIRKDYVYDISLNDDKHEYLTPNGLIHHNTTLAKIISSKFGVLNNPKDNLLAINGSAKETKGINFVDTVIEPFLKIPPAGGDKYRIVFIDEGDYLTDAAVNSLRGIIEKYQVKYGRFILTCNYLSKLSAPFQSRFTPFVFKQLPLSYVKEYCEKILKKEEIKYADNNLASIISGLYPDVRRIVDQIQQSSMSGTLKVNKKGILTTEKTIISSVVEICNHFKNKEPQKVNKLIAVIIKLLDEHDLEYRNIYTVLFNEKEIMVPAKIIINKYANSHRDCLVPNMHFSAMVFELVNSLNRYFQGTK